MAAKILAGKVALVTGSTSGIGAAIARVLGRAGANLVVNGLVSKPEEGEAIRRGFENDLGVKVRCTRRDEICSNYPHAMANLAEGCLLTVPHLVTGWCCVIFRLQVALSTHDLSKRSGVWDMVEHGKKQLGHIDIVVSAGRIKSCAPGAWYRAPCPVAVTCLRSQSRLSLRGYLPV